MAAVVTYLFAMAGFGLLLVELSSVLATQAIALSQPYFLHGPRKPSLIEQRRMEAMLAVQPPREEITRTTLSELPSLPANILAAQLDLAEKEKEDTASSTRVESTAYGSPASQPSSIPTRVYGYEMTTGSAKRPKLRTAHSNSSYAAVAARDVFNRSFGVLTVANQ
jgi:hypothetical protein